MYPKFLRAAVLPLMLFCALAAPARADMKLSYNAPTSSGQWFNGMPIGNGRLGGMIFGDVTSEHVQFNEDTLWSGGPHDYSHAGGASHLASIRSKYYSGNVGGAISEIASSFVSVPLRQEYYAPFGDLRMTFPSHTSIANYSRDLNLSNAVASVEYDYNSVHFTREFFASHPDKLMVLHLEANASSALDTTILLSADEFNAEPDLANPTVVVVGSNVIKMTGSMPTSYSNQSVSHSTTTPLSFEAQVKVINVGGTLTVSGNSLVVAGADSVTILLAAHTSFVNYNDVSGDPHQRCEDDLAAVSGKSYADLKADHESDYQALFNRCTLELGASSQTVKDYGIAGKDLGITDTRRQRFFWNQTTSVTGDTDSFDDPDLVEAYFQFGRYLLIASSRDSEPANLQGLWNPGIYPSWESKYTTNINVEMNYWPAEVTNLGECVQPLINMIKDLEETGHTVAVTNYGATNGWVVHHNTDLWRGAAPVDHADTGMFPAGGAWLSQHMWWRYEYSGDLNFLQNDAYPAMKGAAQFLLETMVHDPRSGYNNWLETSPTYSPEHGTLTAGSTMDNQIVRELFRNTIKAAQILGVDSALQAQLSTAIGEMAPNRVSSQGYLNEWLDEDDSDNGHRHVSHLWGLYPGEDIVPSDAAVWDASVKSLKARIGTNSSSQTGWAMAHRITIATHAGLGDYAYWVLQRLIRSKTYNSLLNNGGSAAGLQVDGNFGATAGIAEMFVQSQNDVISLLPALPTTRFRSGSLTGFRARGGVTVDMSWSPDAFDQVKITSLTLTSDVATTIKLKTPSNEMQGLIRTSDSQGILTTDNGDGTYSFTLEAGRSYSGTASQTTPVRISGFEIE